MAITKDQILKYTHGSEKGEDILRASKAYGFTPEDVDNAYGFQKGYSQSWVDDYEAKTNPKPVTYKPTSVSLGANETVEGRLEGLLSKNNPLLQRARAQSMQQSNRRGLVNSTMAAGAGERAVIETATPIASQDASAFQTAAFRNQDAENQAGMFNAQTANQFSSDRANKFHDSTMQQNQFQQQKDLQTQQGNQSMEQLERQAELNRQNNARNEVTSTARAYDAEIQRILQDPNMDEGAKQAQVNSIAQQRDAVMKLAADLGGIDLSSILGVTA